MITRQAKSIARIRKARVRAGRCRECGIKTTNYRCDTCADARRESHRDYMRKWRAAR